jgi:hypothetical protein
MKARHLAFICLAVALVGALLPGCGAARGPGDERSSERSVGSGSPGGSRPPESTLSYGDQTATGELGSYCWFKEEGSTRISGGMCADAILKAPPEEKTLTVPVGATLHFDYGGEARPDGVEAGVYPMIRGKVASEAEPLRIRREGDQTKLFADLPAGEYVINVFLYVPEGDVSYYFRVVTE